MGITVREALSLEVLQEARLIAGAGGLQREIKRVSVLECPDCEEYRGLLREGDFFLTSFYAFKDRAESLTAAVQTLIQAASSGLCVLDLYLDDLPEQAKQLADRADYPVFIIPQNLPYADVITDIMDLIIQNKENIIGEMQIEQLLQAGSDPARVKQLARQLIPRPGQHILALYTPLARHPARAGTHLREQLGGGREDRAVLTYRQGLLVLLSFPALPAAGRLQGEIERVAEAVRSYTAPASSLGVSQLYEGLEHTGRCIREACLASSLGARALGRPVTSYRELGVYRILALVQEDPEVRAFHDEIILPLMEYDHKNNAQLLKTALAYIEHDGDIARTAQQLFQHANTVRYRLGKIKEILHLEGQEGTFYEQLSLAVKIHKLLS